MDIFCIFCAFVRWFVVRFRLHLASLSLRAPNWTHSSGGAHKQRGPFSLLLSAPIAFMPREHDPDGQHTVIRATVVAAAVVSFTFDGHLRPDSADKNCDHSLTHLFLLSHLLTDAAVAAAFICQLDGHSFQFGFLRILNICTLKLILSTSPFPLFLNCVQVSPEFSWLLLSVPLTRESGQGNSCYCCCCFSWKLAAKLQPPVEWLIHID